MKLINIINKWGVLWDISKECLSSKKERLKWGEAMEYKFAEFRIIVPNKLYSILDFRLVERNNEHIKLSLSCIVPEEERDKCIEEIKRNDNIKITDEESNYIFQGTFDHISLKKHGENYRLDLKAVSYTNELDIKLKSRSFQDLNLTYKDVIEEVLKDYPKKDYLDKATEGKKIDDILVQYHETDWEFLKRIASHFNAPIVPDGKEDYPRITIGEPDLTAEQGASVHNVEAGKNLVNYLDSITNFKVDIDEWDAINYTIETYGKFRLGEKLSFKDRINIVTYAETFMKRGEIKHKYILSSLNGVKVNYIENKNIVGAQLEGIIKEIDRNSVRVHLDIDEEYKGANNKFIYYSGGVNNEVGYYMPKVGSNINLYFPNGNEKNAVVIASVRKNISKPKDGNSTEIVEREVAGQDRMSDPSEKHLRNEFGKEMRLGSKDLEFTTGNDDIKVNLSADGVATVHSNKFITIASKEDMYIGYKDWEFEDEELNEKNKPVKKITMKAEEEIYIKQGEGEDFESGIILNENAAIFTILDNLYEIGEEGPPSLEIPPPDFEEEERLAQEEDARMLEKAKENSEKRKEKQKETAEDLKALITGVAAMHAAIDAVGETSPELVDGLVDNMGLIAENLIKVLAGDEEADNFLLNTLFGGDKEAYEKFKYTFVLSASVMAESWGQILSKDDLSRALRLVSDLMNGTGLDKDLMSAYEGFSQSALASGLMEDFEKRLKEKLKDPFNQFTEEQRKAMDHLLAGLNADCVFGFEPINLNTGNFYMDQEDVSMDEFGGKFKILRSYNSKSGGYDSYFGKGWEFKYSEKVVEIVEPKEGNEQNNENNKDEENKEENQKKLIYYKGDGASITFKMTKEGYYRSPDGKHLTMTKTEEGFELEDKTKTKTLFDKRGLQREIISPKGYSTKLNYDEEGKLREIITPSGKVFKVRLDDNHRICEITLPNEKSLEYKYDSEGNLIAYVDALGEKTTYEYDENHLMTSWHDPNGTLICENVYDKDGRVISQKDGNGSEVKLEYTNRMTKATDPEGNVTKYYCDSMFRNEKTEYPDGTKEEFFFGLSGHLRHKKDKEGNKHEWLYDLEGNLKKEIREDKKLKFYEYNELNLLTKVIDYDETQTEFKYDERGNLVETIRPDGSIFKYEYDEQSRMIKSINPMGNISTYEYEGANLKAFTDPKGNRHEFKYNEMNKLIEIKDPEGNLSKVKYTERGDKIGETSEDGGITEYIQDKGGYVSEIKRVQPRYV